MKTQHHFSDEGLVLSKKKIQEYNQLVTIFSKHHGKLGLMSYGTKKITSKRLSHLETGNVISFSWSEKNDYLTLHETELQYAHSSIKEDSDKLDMMYLVFFILNRILPEAEPEEDIYDITLQVLRKLHKTDMTRNEIKEYLRDVLHILGFIDEEQLEDATFDPVLFTEGLINRKIKL